MSYLGASLEIFPFLIGANTISLVIGNRFSIYLLRHFEPFIVCTIGSCILAFLCLLLLMAVTFLEPTLYLIVGLVIVTAGAVPISGPIASSVFMQLYESNAGTANASMGIARVAIGMLGGLAVTLAHNGTLYPMATLMFIVAVLGAYCFYTADTMLNSIHQTEK